MRFPWRRLARKTIWLAAAGMSLALGADEAFAQNSRTESPLPLPQPHLASSRVEPLQEPVLSQANGPPVAAAKVEPGDRPLPINLATALRLADARPLVIAAAQASLRQAVAEYDQAKVLWLPNLYTGASYYRHDGGNQGNAGLEVINGKDQFMAGGGLAAVVSTADAIFMPLAARQVVRSRTIDIQTARNDAILSVAEASFNVLQTRGPLRGAQDNWP